VIVDTRSQKRNSNISMATLTKQAPLQVVVNNGPSRNSNEVGVGIGVGESKHVYSNSIVDLNIQKDDSVESV